MSVIRFTNVNIFDGTGTAPYAGEVRVSGGLVQEILRGGAPSGMQDAVAIDGGAGPQFRPADSGNDSYLNTQPFAGWTFPLLQRRL